MTLKVGCLFSGIGGLEKGFHDAGYDVVFQVENDEACRTVLRRHWPNVQQYGDIKDVTYEQLKRDLGQRADVDVLVGGWPCQDISLAGPRLGLAGARSGLFYEFARLVAEISPRWLVAENVPGLLSSGCNPPCPGGCIPTHGGDMGAVIGTLGELGYGYAWRVLDAQHFGVPQRRRRVFIVGHLGEPWSAPAEVLLEPESSEGDPEESYEAWEDDAEAVAASPTGLGPGGREGELVSALTSGHGGPDDNMAQAGHLVPQMIVVDEPIMIGSEYGSEVARPVTACEHGHRYDMETENLLVDPRPYTVHGEHSTAMTGGGEAEVAFETERTRSLDTTGGYASNQGGTVIVEPPFAVSMRGREEGNVPEVEEGGVVPAIRTGQGGSGNPMVVTGNDRPREAGNDRPREATDEELANGICTCGDYPYCVEDCNHRRWLREQSEPVYVVHNGDDVITSENVAMPVMGGTKGQPQAVTFRKSQRAHHAEDHETWVEDDVANTLNGFENHNAERTTHAVVTPLDLSQACRTDGSTGVGTPGTGIGEAGGPSYPVGSSKAVPAMIQELSVRRLTPLECERLQGFPDGWTDGQSDSARYKMLGNAVAVPCSAWIARRLLEVDAGC